MGRKSTPKAFTGIHVSLVGLLLYYYLFVCTRTHAHLLARVHLHTQVQVPLETRDIRFQQLEL